MNNAIEVRNLCKSYPGFALKDISFTVPQGLCCGFVGANGAGKSTTMRIMANLAYPDSGEVRLSGRPSSDPSVKKEAAFLFDQPCFQEDWTPRDIEKALRPFYHSWDGAQYRDCLERFGLEPGKKFKNMSRGMKQKLAMAVHLSRKTRILLLDEPTGGLDPVARDELLDIFREYLIPEDRTILFSTHITSDLEKIADYIVFIHEGKVVFEKTKDELTERYGIIKCGAAQFDALDKSDIISYRKMDYEWQILVSDREKMQKKYPKAPVVPAAIDEIMLLYIKGEKG